MSSADAQNIDPARYAILVKDYIEAKRRYDLAKEALQPGEPTKIPAHGEPMKSRCGHVVPTPWRYASENWDEGDGDDELCLECGEEGAASLIIPYESPSEKAYFRAWYDWKVCEMRFKAAFSEVTRDL